MAKQPKTASEPEAAFQPEKTKDGRTLYEITEKAPAYIAGRRVAGEREIALFEEEARAELLSGHIWPKGMPRKEPAVTKDDVSGEAGSNDA